MKIKETDKQAWDAHESGMTWAEVARLMHYANGSVARRAAMRFGTDGQTKPTVDVIESDNIESDKTESADAQETTGWVERQHEFVASWEGSTKPLADLKEGDLVYYHQMPKATYAFVKWNPDGSAQVWGGNFGFAAYRDWHVDKLSRMPATDEDHLVHWATENLFMEVTTEYLVRHLGISMAVVRRVIKDRPDVFRRRVGSRIFEIRDPQADRSADKARAS